MPGRLDCAIEVFDRGVEQRQEPFTEILRIGILSIDHRKLVETGNAWEIDTNAANDRRGFCASAKSHAHVEVATGRLIDDKVAYVFPRFMPVVTVRDAIRINSEVRGQRVGPVRNLRCAALFKGRYGQLKTCSFRRFGLDPHTMPAAARNLAIDR